MATTAPTAAAATATVMIEREYRSRMTSSLICFQLSLLQRVIFDAHEIGGVVLCRRVRAPTLRKRELLGAGSPHQPRQAIVSFDAAGLVVKPVVLVALPGELLADGPSLGPHRRIFDGDDVLER